ncbi:hypothetical protein AAVH_35182, partial [Aphelenchoides avenae]
MAGIKRSIVFLLSTVALLSEVVSASYVRRASANAMQMRQVHSLRFQRNRRSEATCQGQWMRDPNVHEA